MEDVALIRSDKVIWGGTMGSQGSPLWSFCAQAPGGQIWASTRHERTGSRHKKCLTHVWIYVWISYNQVIINIIRNLKGTYITIWRELCRAFSQFASKMLHWPWPLRSKAQGIHGTMASMMESWKKQDTFANHPSELGKPCWDFWVPWVP
jgi:hypothetical protein